MLSYWSGFVSVSERVPLSWPMLHHCLYQAWPELRGNGGHGLANLKKVLGLQFKHYDAGEDARAAAEVTLKAEASMGRKIRLLNASRQLIFDFQ
ncbi:3'-5' exonuclease family protein [Tritonibacter scottomollicae]|uniref:hypothetical protein n=1 Tax=Tritonibacter scottomollicae TaxID=483013 RepID=UPI00374D034F